MEKYRVEVHDNGTVMFFKEGTNSLHRLNFPAIERANGDKEWFKDGKRHRTDGPAVECCNGLKEYWVNGELHRLDGPAVENKNGYKAWYQNNLLHRTDGPAVEHPNGIKEFWIKGAPISEKEFQLESEKEFQLETIKNKIINDVLEEISERADKIYIYGLSGLSNEAAIGKAFNEIVCKYAKKK